jgi:hypothetical protein
LEGGQPASVGWGTVGIVLAGLVGFAWTAARGLHMPKTYAVGHWLHNYDFGFVKRGLLGELFQPFLTHKASDEAFQVIVLLSVLVFAAHAALLLRAAWQLSCAGREAGEPWLPTLAAGVFLTSPFVVMHAHLMGYPDHWMVLAVFGSLACLARGVWWGAGAIGAAALLLHEMYGLAGFPVVAFAAWLQLPKARAARARAALALGVPVAVAGLAILLASAFQDGAQVAALRQQMTATGLLNERSAQMSTYHLANGFADNLRDQSGDGLARLLDRATLTSVAPPAAFLLGAGILWGVRAGRRRQVPAFVMMMMAPLLMHWIAWDRARVSTLILFHGFVGLAVLLAVRDGRPTPALPRAAQAGVAACALAVVFANVSIPVPLMEAQIDGKGLLEVRSVPKAARYACRTPLFRNADFEQGTLAGWSALGDAFVDQPVDRDPAGARRFTGNQGRYWATSAFGRVGGTSPRAPGDAAKGALRSPDFVIRGDEIVFLLGGGQDREGLYVALVVEGEEVLRATGPQSDALATVRWPVVRYRDKTAYVVAVDQSTAAMGHLAVDGFCYAK